MAKVVVGIASSHTPQLSSGSDMWSDHAARDRANAQLLGADGDLHTFDELARDEDHALQEQLRPEVWAAKYARAQECIEMLADRLSAAAPDVLLIVGDDQRELFDDEAMPAVALYSGDELWDRPATGQRAEALSRYPGIVAAQWASHGEEPARHLLHQALTMHLLEALTLDGFDLTRVSAQRADHTLGHAFTYARYRLHLPVTIPIVPVFLNTYYPPNVLGPGRCYELGRALRRAVDAFEEPIRVAVLASGGLSHFVVLENLDRKVLDAMAKHDKDALDAIPRKYFRTGTSEILNWITVAGFFEDAEMDVIDYLPGYRSIAGTGTGMAFATWNPRLASPDETQLR